MGNFELTRRADDFNFIHGSEEIHQLETSEIPVKCLLNRDCHGFLNPCRFWVGYTRVWVRVGFCEPLLNPYPQGRLAGFPRVFHLWRTSTCTANLLLLMNVDQLYYYEFFSFTLHFTLHFPFLKPCLHNSLDSWT
jgi:hypothetical protein